MNNMKAGADEEEQDNSSRWNKIINNQFAFIGQKPFCANFKILQKLEKELQKGDFVADLNKFLSEILPTVSCGELTAILNGHRWSNESLDILHFALRRLSEIQEGREPKWEEILLALSKIERLDVLKNLQPEIEEWVNSLKKSGKTQQNQCCCNKTQQQQTQNMYMYIPMYFSIPGFQQCFFQPNYANYSVPYNFTPTSSMHPIHLPSYNSSDSFSSNHSRNNFNIGNTNREDDFNTGINKENLDHRDKVRVFLTYSEDGDSIASELYLQLETNDIKVFTEKYYFENDLDLQLEGKIPILLNKVDYVVPILTEQYLKDIKEADTNSDRSLNVRALYSYYINQYINSGAKNFKVRPVCKNEYSPVFVKKRKELTPCLCMPHKLWGDFDMFIRVLKNRSGKSA